MSDQIYTSETPAGTDNNNVATQLGQRFTVSASGRVVVGGRWWVPSTVNSGGGIQIAKWQLWRESDQVKLDEVDLMAFAPFTPDGWLSFTPAATPLSTSEAYLEVVYSNSSTGGALHFFALNGSGSYPKGTGVVSSNKSVFRNGGTANDYPNGDAGSVEFFTDVLVGVATVFGSGSAALGAVGGSATGRRIKSGAGSASLAELTPTGAGSRLKRGAAVIDLGRLVASAAGARAKLGAGVAALGGLHATAIGPSTVRPGALTSRTAGRALTSRGRSGGLTARLER